MRLEVLLELRWWPEAITARPSGTSSNHTVSSGVNAGPRPPDAGNPADQTLGPPKDDIDEGSGDRLVVPPGRMIHRRSICVLSTGTSGGRRARDKPCNAKIPGLGRSSSNATGLSVRMIANGVPCGG